MNREGMEKENVKWCKIGDREGVSVHKKRVVEGLRLRRMVKERMSA